MEFRFQRAAALEQALVAVKIERGDARRRRERMAGIGVAMENIDGVVRVGLKRLVDLLLDQHAAHRHRAIGDALGEGDHVGDDAVTLGGKAIAEPPEAGDDLIEDEQNAVAVADFAQAREIRLGRCEDPARSRHGLDDHRGDGLAAHLGADGFQRVGVLRAARGLALGEAVARGIIGQRQAMIRTRKKRAETLLIVGQPAQRHAAEIDAMIGARG